VSWFKGWFSRPTKDVVSAVGDTLDELFTSDEERNAAKIVMEKLRLQPGKLQAQINLVEAAHRSVFVAGWRPFIGWVCGASLATYFLPQFIISAVVWVMAIHALAWKTIPPYPADPSALFELVIAMLGMGVMRTAEKAMGKTK
jgi:hypothetical protein